jgi:hypothetical protein
MARIRLLLDDSELSEAAMKSPGFEIPAMLGSWVAVRVPETLATLEQLDR